MELNVLSSWDVKMEVLFLGLFEGETESSLNEINPELSLLFEKKMFTGTFGEQYSTKIHSLSYNKVVLLGLGKKKELTLERVRRALGKCVKIVRSLMLQSFTTDIVQKVKCFFQEEQLGRAVSESLYLGQYQFLTYLSGEKREKKKELLSIGIVFQGGKDFAKGIDIGRIIAENTNFVRNLVNEPASVVTPDFMEETAGKLAKECGFRLRVLHNDELENEGLHALLQVGVGSVYTSRLIVLEYMQGGKERPIALLGKGITFDSGGYNIKLTNFIETMKYDMAGAGAVFGVLRAAAELQLKKNIIGVIPVCENLISGSAQKPGDIVTFCNGKTVEVTNTDAEGRLVLADALAYTEKTYSPSMMVDIATLTGACVVALGYYTAAVMGKSKEIIAALMLAGDKSGDRVWELPFFEEYQDWMDGSISDLRNTTSRGKGYEAGAILGGVFLSKFVSEAEWVHIDIAGTGFLVEDDDYLQKGATGAGVRLLSYWLLE